MGSQTIDPLSYVSLALVAQSFTLLPVNFAMMILVKSTTTPISMVVISLPTPIDNTKIHAYFLWIINSINFNLKRFKRSYT